MGHWFFFVTFEHERKSHLKSTDLRQDHECDLDHRDQKEQKEYKTQPGFFSPLEGDWVWDTDKDGIGAYIAPYLIGGGEGQTTGFTNYLKDNRKHNSDYD